MLYFYIPGTTTKCEKCVSGSMDNSNRSVFDKTEYKLAIPQLCLLWFYSSADVFVLWSEIGPSGFTCFLVRVSYFKSLLCLFLPES